MRFRRLVDPRTAMADSVRDPVFPIWAAAACAVGVIVRLTLKGVQNSDSG